MSWIVVVDSECDDDDDYDDLSRDLGTLLHQADSVGVESAAAHFETPRPLSQQAWLKLFGFLTHSLSLFLSLSLLHLLSHSISLSLFLSEKEKNANFTS